MDPDTALSQKIWVTKGGVSLRIRDMRYYHICNTIAMLGRKLVAGHYKGDIKHEERREKYFWLFHDELTRRGCWRGKD